MAAKSGRYRLSPLAEADLEEIWDYTVETWSLMQAERYHAGLIEAIRTLATGLKVGQDAADIRNGYWKYAVGRHFIFYVISNDRLDVMRILHQQMDVEERLREQ